MVSFLGFFFIRLVGCLVVEFDQLLFRLNSFFEILNIHFLNDISSRRQQHYHSQRSARETRMSPPGGNAWSGSERPVSNYFEYESLHIAGHKVALSGPPYK